MTDSVEVSREIAAPAGEVWALVADVTRMGEWSPETTEAVWVKGATGPAEGARFRGSNRNGARRWKTVSTVLDATEGKRFSFRVDAAGLQFSEWAYDFAPTDGGCLVTETWIDCRGRLASLVSSPASGVKDRVTHNRATMEETLDRLANAAESGD